MPLDWGAKKQDCSSCHTQEAETVSAAVGLRNTVIPMQILLQTFLFRPVDIHIHEDNAASIAAVKRGYSPSLRHLLRTHRTSLGFLHDICHKIKALEGEGSITMQKEESEKQKGDFFTKFFNGPNFKRALELLQIRDG